MTTVHSKKLGLLQRVRAYHRYWTQKENLLSSGIWSDHHKTRLTRLIEKPMDRIIIENCERKSKK